MEESQDSATRQLHLLKLKRPPLGIVGRRCVFFISTNTDRVLYTKQYGIAGLHCKLQPPRAGADDRRGYRYVQSLRISLLRVPVSAVVGQEGQLGHHQQASRHPGHTGKYLQNNIWAHFTNGKAEL